jgi:hypothetical protein
MAKKSRKKVKKSKAKRRKPSARKKPTRKAAKPSVKNSRAERELEEGLRETFPGSDPLAVTDPTRSIKE